MKIRFAAVFATAAALAFSVPCAAFSGGSGSMGGRSGGGFGHPMWGVHAHHFVFHQTLHPFQSGHLNFGRTFRSRSTLQSTGGYGGDDYDNDYDNDDISSLHFRVQEPFGPGDIGRPPIRAEVASPYMEGQSGPPPGYGPEDW